VFKTGWPNVAEDADHPHHAGGKAVVDEIQQLGGKFAIVFMPWMGKILAAFQTKLMDHFQNGLEGK